MFSVLGSGVQAESRLENRSNPRKQNLLASDQPLCGQVLFLSGQEGQEKNSFMVSGFLAQELALAVLGNLAGSCLLVGWQCFAQF